MNQHEAAAEEAGHLRARGTSRNRTQRPPNLKGGLRAAGSHAGAPASEPAWLLPGCPDPPFRCPDGPANAASGIREAMVVISVALSDSNHTPAWLAGHRRWLWRKHKDAFVLSADVWESEELRREVAVRRAAVSGAPDPQLRPARGTRVRGLVLQKSASGAVRVIQRRRVKGGCARAGRVFGEGRSHAPGA